MSKKNLVSYFSWGGNTKSIAEKIHNIASGDMFEIETAIPYPEKLFYLKTTLKVKPLCHL